MAPFSPLRALLLVGAALTAAPAGVLAAPAVHTVTIRQLMFGAMPAGLRVGDAIEWVNGDIFTHSATAKDKSFDVELKPQARARIVLSKAGTFGFICRYHPGMTGTLVVQDRKRP